jgi:hypothetical protein
MAVAELVGRKPPTHTRLDGQAVKLEAHGGAGPRAPRVGPSMTQNYGPGGSSIRAASQGRSCSQPHASMPISRRRPPLP